MIARLGLAVLTLAALPVPPAAADGELGGFVFSQRVAIEVVQRRAQVCAALAGAYQRNLPKSPPVGTGWPVAATSRLCRR